jgi:hypothetical protein
VNIKTAVARSPTSMDLLLSYNAYILQRNSPKYKHVSPEYNPNICRAYRIIPSMYTSKMNSIVSATTDERASYPFLGKMRISYPVHNTSFIPTLT